MDIGAVPVIARAILALIALAAASCGENTRPPATAHAASGDGIVVATGEGIARIGPATYRVVEPAELGVQSASSIWAAIEPIAGQVPEGAEGRQGMDIWIHENDRAGEFAATILRFGLLDDAVKADETRVTFTHDGSEWRPVAAYVRQQCRSMGDGEWTTEPCA